MRDEALPHNVSTLEKMIVWPQFKCICSFSIIIACLIIFKAIAFNEYELSSCENQVMTF